MEPTPTFSNQSVIPPAVDVTSRAVRVLVVEDDALVRDWYRSLLSSMEELAAFEIVGEADTGDVAEHLARELRPDIVLLDLGLPDRDGVAVARQLRNAVPAARILVLTGAAEDDARAAALVRLGVAGYLAKHTGLAAIVDALRAVAAGQTRLPHAGLQQAMAIEETPTAREQEILQMIAHGYSTRAIADEMHIRERTVRFHLANLFAKLGAASRPDMLYRARQRHWLP